MCVYRWRRQKIIPLNSLHRKHTPDKGVIGDLSSFHWYESEHPPVPIRPCMASSSSSRSGESEACTQWMWLRVPVEKVSSTRPWRDTLHPADTELEFAMQTLCPGLWSWACGIRLWCPTETCPWSRAETGRRTLPTTGRPFRKARSSTRSTRSAKKKATGSCQTDVRHQKNDI